MFRLGFFTRISEYFISGKGRWTSFFILLGLLFFVGNSFDNHRNYSEDAKLFEYGEESPAIILDKKTVLRSGYRRSSRAYWVYYEFEFDEDNVARFSDRQHMSRHAYDQFNVGDVVSVYHGTVGYPPPSIISYDSYSHRKFKWLVYSLSGCVLIISIIGAGVLIERKFLPTENKL
ncbi:MAG: hypothetical protein ABJ275_11765 [Maricaulaceae bacterium]